ncbi:MAG: transposase [Sporolactobacillus sp.]
MARSIRRIGGCRLAQLIPWPRIEKKYARVFRNATPKGVKPYSAHLAFGALIIQQRQKLTDRETVEQIAENPYMQYFLGLEAFQQTMPTVPSLHDEPFS